MASTKNEDLKYLRVANTLSILIVLFLSASFIFETLIAGAEMDYSIAGLLMFGALAIVIAVIRGTRNYYKMALNVPIVLFIFYTLLMRLSNWNYSHYLLVCLAFCSISCIYSSFYRTVTYIVINNIIIGFLIFRGVPIAGPGIPLIITMVNWVVCIFTSVVMLILTRYATIVLNKAIEHRNSFRNLLATTENFVAMIDEGNKVVYASKTLSELGGVEDNEHVQGRPLIDLFPGKALKIYAGKMIKEKDNYAEDWEFSLNGQKRYFKAASHSLLAGKSSGSLISLYDMTHLAERDEIAAMKDSMQIGLFFMDNGFIIQDHYSKYLEEMLSESELFGKVFTEIIKDSVSSTEMEGIKDYLGMVMERSYDQEMLDDINPLNELHYVNARTGDRKVFQFAFSTVEKDKGEVHLLVTVYDITAKVELQQRLAEEEAKRQEEMQAFFELVQVDPEVFNDFMDDMEHEFTSIDKILKNDELSAHEALVKVYQSVHAIKSNAVILGLSIFGNKVHNLESKIKKMREQDKDVPFVEMLNLTMDIEKISQEREGFKNIIDKLQSYSGQSGSGEKQNVKVLMESLSKTTTRAAEDLEKMVQFVAEDIDNEAIEKGPRRVMKEILMQLIRNSVVHGVEKPEDRTAKGKDETGTIKLSIKMTEDRKNIHIKLSDDGKGLDYKRIAERAVANKVIKKEDAGNKDMLIKAIFAPGFSTAEVEGVHGGRGIGLNLVRDRIKEVNGSIKLRSEPDKGTVFFVVVPAVDKEKPVKKK
jgi:two-component system chemotaxis sensor kinase CheA